MTPRRFLVLLFAVLSPLGCSDSTGPTATVARQLYYISYPPEGDPYGLQLYGSAVDGSLPVPLLGDSLRGVFRLGYDLDPWVSADGRTIKVLADSAGGALFVLSLSPWGELQAHEPYQWKPRWPQPRLSPDGTRQTWFADGYLNIALLDGTILQHTYFDSLRAFSYAVGWSRDGKWLAYVSGLRDSFNPYSGSRDERVWVLRLSDGFKRPVTEAGEGRTDVAWSRDGRWLLFRSATGLNRVPADGSGPEQSVYIGGAGAPSFGPNDDLLAFLYGGVIRLLQPDGSGGSSLPGVGRIYAFGWGN